MSLPKEGSLEYNWQKIEEETALGNYNGPVQITERELDKMLLNSGYSKRFLNSLKKSLSE